jgi:enoyl-CoA hydratase
MQSNGSTGEAPEPAVLTSEERGILTIRLNRPNDRNAVNTALATGVSEALDRLDAEPGLRVGVITGNGEGFSAGMDLKALLRNESPMTHRGFAGIVRKPPNKPLIAAVEGFALAGGLEIAMSCDLIVAARGARMGIPEVKRGLVAAAGGLMRLPRRIPYHAAMYLAITGKSFTAERAYELGLVSELCDPGKALEAAIELARVVIRNAPLSVQASKEIVRDALDLNEAEGWELQDRVAYPPLYSEDAKEGARAFVEKREPVWQGR